WVGTAFGLNRFDGGIFKKYVADPTKKNKTILGNEISGLIEDSLHNIWIGSVKGLSCYDIKADSFKNIYSNLSKNEIVPFWATNDEVFCWDFPEEQLTAYNIYSTKKRTLTKYTRADTVGFGVSYRYTIYEAVSNSIWMLKGYRGTGGGLLQISLANGERHLYDWPCYLNIPNHSHWSEGMRYDRKRNSIWINSTDGLIEFRLNDRMFHHIDVLNEFVNLKDYWRWAGIDIDRDGRVWIATKPKGIIIYDPGNNSANLLFPNDSVQQEKVCDENVILYCDKDGMTWSGFFSRKGIYQIIPFAPAANHYVGNAHQSNSLTNNLVFNFINADHGRIWMGSSDGIKVFDPDTGFLNLIRAKDLAGLKGDFLFPINVDTIGKKAWIIASGFWITGDGLYEMDLNTRKCSPVLYEDSNGRKLPLSSILVHHPDNVWVFKYKNECIIVATLPDHQEILLVNRNTPVARKVLSFLGEPIDMASTCTNDNNLIFLKRPDASTNLTYSFQNNHWICVHTPIDTIQWSGVFYNKTDQTYWIIAETQLIHFDKNFRVMHNYTNDDGMPGLKINGLTPDNKGNIWFNTDRSIFQLNVKTGTITMLAEKDGFLTQNISAFSDTKDKDGDLYINADDAAGFYRISPDKYIFSASSVYLESLKINQQLFPLSTGINFAEKISLKYFENNIDIETGVIDFNSKGKGHIRYKLEADGKTASWQYAPAYYTIRYEGLPPGNYRLILQSSNAANEFNGPEKVLSIIIHPAFWNTWWFRTLASIFVLGIFYLLIRYRTQQRFRLKLERSEKETQLAEMRQNTAELKQQSSELEMQALRAQMNPHFIFNSLNSINRFILKNDRLQASEYLTKFSKLVRMILQNSQSPLIPLESELESLGLYLEMEALRFNYHFAYKISIPKDLDVEVLKVPPLILQPYVENAIWHGLMHKEEKGLLNIEVSQEDDHLYFKVTDNGIGRKKAAEIASKSATKHKSMGLRITAHRIAMMQHTNGEESPVKINDLVESDGTAAGTEVIIKMPVIEME
ncbi:MAG: histidine kinase, partial [Bacteroidota bacterium]